MKKRRVLYVYLGLLMVMLFGCSRTQQEDVSLEIWHYYNGPQKIAFDDFVDDFNETVGLEKGIIIEAYSQGNIDQLEDKIINSVENKVGSSEIPDMVTTYSETAYNLDQRGFISNLEDYLTAEELDEYIGSYIEEGRLGEKNEFKIFPTAKATEVLMLNKTDWDKFATATGATIKDLETWEGIHETGKLYYEWTDSLTETENDGEAFFGRDALANYILVGSKQLGTEIFQVEGEEVRVDLDSAKIRRIWDHYYIPYISGYYTSYGKFSSDDASIGKVIALVGSTTGATYFPENVTIADNDSYPIELLVLPLPNFEDTPKSSVQQGAGIVVLKSDAVHEQASVEFLKWFTEADRNSEFSIKTGYLPVKKAAYNIEKFKEEFEKETGEELPKKLQATIPLAMEQMETYDLYYSQAFTKGFQARQFLETELKDKSFADREKVIEQIGQGLSHEEAVSEFTSDENFAEWFEKVEERLVKVVRDEE